MSARKHRMTITVDPELFESAASAVADGRAESISGWVSAALEDKVARDRKLTNLRAAVASYEAEFGEISPEELAARARTDRANATIVRSRAATTGSA